jgi:hypothetical protein
LISCVISDVMIYTTMLWSILIYFIGYFSINIHLADLIYAKPPQN